MKFNHCRTLGNKSAWPRPGKIQYWHPLKKIFSTRRRPCVDTNFQRKDLAYSRNPDLTAPKGTDRPQGHGLLMLFFKNLPMRRGTLTAVLFLSDFPETSCKSLLALMVIYS